MNVSGGCKSYRLKKAYSTVRRFASCAMVIVDPQPLPMSPGAAAAAGVPGTAAVVAIAGGTSVQFPEKSTGACACVFATSAAKIAIFADSVLVISIPFQFLKAMVGVRHQPLLRRRVRV